MLTEIKLYGDLGEKYGESLFLAVTSVHEALRALNANFPSFRSDIVADGEYHVLIDGKDIGEEDLLNPTGHKTISIIPKISGSKGFFKIIVGILLIYLAVVTGGAALAGAFGQAGSLGASLGGLIGKGLMSIGTSLLFGGISEMFFSPPKAVSTEPIDSKPSYLFTGSVNTVGQGQIVPVGYGRLIVGSAVISATIDTVDN